VLMNRVPLDVRRAPAEDSIPSGFHARVEPIGGQVYFSRPGDLRRSMFQKHTHRSSTGCYIQELERLILRSRERWCIEWIAGTVRNWRRRKPDHNVHPVESKFL
jgi:hypothetical protein